MVTPAGIAVIYVVGVFLAFVGCLKYYSGLPSEEVPSIAEAFGWCLLWPCVVIGTVVMCLVVGAWGFWTWFCKSIQPWKSKDEA